MKKLIFFITVLLYLNLSKAYALQPVIDSAVVSAINAQTSAQTTSTGKSFTEFVNQTTAITKNLLLTTQQLEALTSQFNFSLNFRDYTNDIIGIYETNLQALTPKSIGGKLLSNTSIGEISQLLNNIYPSVENPNANIYEPLITKYKADSYKSALELSEFFLNNAPKEVEDMSKIASDMENTQNVKEAMDVNNRLLSEVLFTLQKQNQLLAQLVRTESASKYEGNIETATTKTETRTQEVQGSFERDVDVFKVNKNDLPFKRTKPSLIDKIFKGYK